jgi:hypothetical protein
MAESEIRPAKLRGMKWTGLNKCFCRDGAIIVHLGYMVRLTTHSVEPPLDCCVTRQVEPGIISAVGIGIQGNVGDGVAIRSEPAARKQMLIHD